MKQYKVVETNKKNAEDIMNDMARQGWRVVSMTYWSYWNVSLLITFEREIETKDEAERKDYFRRIIEN